MTMEIAKKIIRTYLVAEGIIISEMVLESICHKLIEEGSLKKIKLSTALFSANGIKHPFRKNKNN